MEGISVLGLTIQPAYDKIKRNKGKQILVSGTKIAEESVVYRKVGDHATNMCASMYFGCVKNGRYTRNEHLKYAYDAMGNITHISENGNLVARYGYDKLNRLVREDNKRFGKTWLYTYDNNGNLLCKRETDFTLEACAEKGEFVCHTYEYEGDKLLSYNEESFEYDPIGNPTIYRGKQAEWKKGRRLMSYNGHTFVYDEQGRRVQKDGITFTYDSQGRLIKQSNGLTFFYDYTGVAGFTYNNATYLYRKDAQKNVVAILNTDGTVLVRYAYDAWGNYTYNEPSGEGLGELNPFRYRSYYYDTETELYFLKTRYYDPEIGRFMTIDGVGYLNSAVVNGLNLYAYCGNNPIMAIDPNGNAWWNPFSWDWKSIGKVVGGAALAVVGAAATIATLPVATVVPGGGAITQACLSTAMYGGFTMASVFDSTIQADMDNIGWNPFNSDESLAIGSSKVSFFKGVPIIRHSISDVSSGSFWGLIALKRGHGNEALKHEWGHAVQFWLLGVQKYFGIAIPSVIGALLYDDQAAPDTLSGWIAKNYYFLPWESTAELFGGANNSQSNHREDSFRIGLAYFISLMLL